MTIFEFTANASATAILPTKAHQNDAGWDLYLDSDDPVCLYPMQRKLCATGVRLAEGAIHGAVGLICPRSGLAHKFGVTVLNAPGVLDQDYTGEIMVNLISFNEDVVILDGGDRIGQLVFVPLLVTGPNDSTLKIRGEGGHGSSGR